MHQTSSNQFGNSKIGGHSRTFGRRQCANSTDNIIPSRHGLALVIFAVLAAGVAFYTWTIVLSVPFERPFAGIYSNQRPQLGWAPWWVAPLVAAAFSGLVARMLRRRSQNPSLFALLTISLCVAWGSFAIAHVVRNIGHIILNVDGGSLSLAVAAMPQLTLFHLLQTPHVVMLDGHNHLVAFALAAGLLSWVVLGGNNSLFVTSHDAADVQQNLLVSDRARLISGGAMGLFMLSPLTTTAGSIGSLGAVVVALVWYFYGFPQNRFNWWRLLGIGIGVPSLVLFPIYLRLFPIPEMAVSTTAAGALGFGIMTFLVSAFVRRTAKKL